VVDHAIEPAELLPAAIDHGAGLVVAGNIAGDSDCLNAELVDGGGGVFRVVLGARIVDGDVIAATGELQARGAADAGAATSDQGDLAGWFRGAIDRRAHR